MKNSIAGNLLAFKRLSSRQQELPQSFSCLTYHFDFLNLLTKWRIETWLLLSRLYLPKAFDHVPQPHLTYEVGLLGIVNPLLSWIPAFPARRSEVAFIADITSNVPPITISVIQRPREPSLLFLCNEDAKFCYFMVSASLEHRSDRLRR